MPTTYNLDFGTRSSTILTAGTLASGTYITGSAIDLGVNTPAAFTLQAVANANGTPSGNKQLVIFGKWSQDNTVWTSGPESGTTTTEEADLHLLGALPMNDTNDHIKEFLVPTLARYFKPIFKNDLGVALTSGELYRQDILGESN